MHFILFFEGAPDALGAGRDDLAKNVFVADDLEVVGHVGRRRNEGEKAGHRGSAADRLEQIPIAQDLGKSDQVDALPGIPQLHQDDVNGLVRGNVKVFLVNFFNAFRDDFPRRDQHGTKHALLGFNAMRQGPVNILRGRC
jgi:hypothetical protein